MSTRNSSKSSLFLIELIIAILFFSIGSAVCVRAFVKAHSLSTEAKDLSFASAQVSSMASVLKYTDRSYASIREHFPDAAKSGDDFLVFYDEEGTSCQEKDAHPVPNSLSTYSSAITGISLSVRGSFSILPMRSL